MSLQQNIAAAQVGRYGTHATFSSYVLPGPRAKRGPAFSLPHAAVPGPIGLLCKHWKHLRTTNVIESSFATVQPGGGIAILWSHTNEQTGAPAFGYPAKDQRELAAECRRLKSMLVADKHPYRKLVPAHMCCAARRMPAPDTGRLADLRPN